MRNTGGAQAPAGGDGKAKMRERVKKRWRKEIAAGDRDAKTFKPVDRDKPDDKSKDRKPGKEGQSAREAQNAYTERGNADAQLVYGDELRGINRDIETTKSHGVGIDQVFDAYTREHDQARADLEAANAAAVAASQTTAIEAGKAVLASQQQQDTQLDDARSALGRTTGAEAQASVAGAQTAAKGAEMGGHSAVAMQGQAKAALDDMDRLRQIIGTGARAEHQAENTGRLMDLKSERRGTRQKRDALALGQAEKYRESDADRNLAIKALLSKEQQAELQRLHELGIINLEQGYKEREREDEQDFEQGMQDDEQAYESSEARKDRAAEIAKSLIRGSKPTGESNWTDAYGETVALSQSETQKARQTSRRVGTIVRWASSQHGAKEDDLKKSLSKRLGTSNPDVLDAILRLSGYRGSKYMKLDERTASGLASLFPKGVLPPGLR